MNQKRKWKEIKAMSCIKKKFMQSAVIKHRHQGLK